MPAFLQGGRENSRAGHELSQVNLKLMSAEWNCLAPGVASCHACYSIPRAPERSVERSRGRRRASGSSDVNETDAVLFEVDAHIATVTLNRPVRRNALSIAATNRLFEILQEIDRGDDIRAIVLTGADCGTFCAGMDLKEAAEIKAKRGVDVLTLVRDPFHERMRAVRKPIIAAMTGHFTAGGMMLSLNSDLRVGLAGTMGGITEAKLGRGSPWAMPLLWMLPQPLMMEMTLCGGLIPIERFLAVGFVNYVETTPDGVRARAHSLAEQIRDNAPLSVLAAKESIVATMNLGCERGFAEAKRIHAKVYASDDAQEGPRAFAEKRAPVWQGH
jgi:enoyl-CoA hydratase/carnithine racemase